MPNCKLITRHCRLVYFLAFFSQGPFLIARQVDVYVWNASSAEISPGHVMLTEAGTRNVLLSEFPRWPLAQNEKLSFENTLVKEARPPTKVFRVNVPDDDAFSSAVQDHATRTWWEAYSSDSNATQCTRAAFESLTAGGLKFNQDAGTPTLPGTFGDMLRDLARNPDSGVKPLDVIQPSAAKNPWLSSPQNPNSVSDLLNDAANSYSTPFSPNASMPNLPWTDPFAFHDPATESASRPIDPATDRERYRNPSFTPSNGAQPSSKAKDGRTSNYPQRSGGPLDQANPIPFHGPDETIQVPSCESFNKDIAYQQEKAKQLLADYTGGNSKPLPPEPKPEMVVVRKSDFWNFANSDYIRYSSGCPGCAAAEMFVLREWANQQARSDTNPDARHTWAVVASWAQDFINAAHFSETSSGLGKTLYGGKTFVGASTCMLAVMFRGAPQAPRFTGTPGQNSGPKPSKGSPSSPRASAGQEGQREPGSTQALPDTKEPSPSSGDDDWTKEEVEEWIRDLPREVAEKLLWDKFLDWIGAEGWKRAVPAYIPDIIEFLYGEPLGEGEDEWLAREHAEQDFNSILNKNPDLRKWWDGSDLNPASPNFGKSPRDLKPIGPSIHQ